MTSSEFKYAIQNNIIGNNTHKVLVNYNIYGSIYKIDAVAIRIENNLTQLQQATAISIITTGQPINIPVDNSSSPVRVVDRQIVGDYYLYNILTESQRVQIPGPGSIDNSARVIIEPQVGISPQTIVDYSAIQGTVLNNRESRNIVHSDRLFLTSGSKTNPANLYSIVNDVAIPAQIQDSNYSSTGWVNGRYNGSKITAATNYNADPFIQGAFFEGAFFGREVDDLYITELAPSDLDLQQYFFSGKLETLRYTLEHINTVTDGGYTGTDTSIQFKNNPTGPPPYKRIPPLHVGELFRIDNAGAPVIISSEIMQMVAPTGSNQQYFPYLKYASDTNSEYLTMQVSRGYGETKKDTSILSNSELYRIVPTKVYSLTGNFAQALLPGKIRVKSTKEVVYIGKDGFVISGSVTDFLPKE